MRGVGTWRGGVAAVPAPFEPAFAACRPKNRSIVAFPPRFGLFGRRPHPLARRSADKPRQPTLAPEDGGAAPAPGAPGGGRRGRDARSGADAGSLLSLRLQRRVSACSWPCKGPAAHGKKELPLLSLAFSCDSCPRRVPDAPCAVRRTVLAVAGKDFAIVAGDTRCSTGFSIMSRNVSKIYQM